MLLIGCGTSVADATQSMTPFSIIANLLLTKPTEFSPPALRLRGHD
jgi:hypothetical protein